MVRSDWQQLGLKDSADLDGLDIESLSDLLANEGRNDSITASGLERWASKC